MTAPRLRVDDFDYQLPADAIAQTPAEPRDASRLLVLDRATGTLQHATFRDVGRWLRAGDLLVVNDSRVIPARLAATRVSGGSAELLVLRQLDDAWHWEALVRPSRRLAVGDTVTLRNGAVVEVGERLGDGTRVVAFPDDRDPHQLMAEAGEMPLPPYIRDRSAPPDRYQTVYARPPGSAAAPTAGLHFTPELLARLEAAGVERATVTLHVGLDTFRPLEGSYVDEHRIHTEWYEVPDATRDAITRTRERGGRVVAVGTTAVRVLETATRTEAASGWTDLYVTPPHRFGAVDALITNFHLPRSSLLLLVTAFVQAGMADGTDAYAARDVLLDAYRVALSRGYRFFSFGDAMLIR
ncbi:MAG TPA: tRNA preQ1(34) S-adenosylmethionine ribosyltransferase-isomerase QueA [Candidatus Limnocylindria bacterium]|jgi:S-adenosylmethionine:tRNA ribosyltransferase-isomerase|nr:tRNA preQ1(34) S-adenosylmethionine ribosyltransferase-isomerase QueA [Candidatus Limnocylindria bacterium]